MTRDRQPTPSQPPAVARCPACGQSMVPLGGIMAGTWQCEDNASCPRRWQPQAGPPLYPLRT